MKNTQKHAFILTECNSPYIAQAIFILRNNVSAEENGVLADAERIVAAYMNNDFKDRLPPGKSKLSPRLRALLCGAIVLTATLACIIAAKLLF